MTPGAQVLCIDATPPATHNRAPKIDVARTYTVVRAIRQPHRGVIHDGLIIAEARFPPSLDGVEHGWLARRFMPAVA